MWQGMGGEDSYHREGGAETPSLQTGPGKVLAEEGTEMPSEEGYGAAMVWRVGTFSRRNFTTRYCSHQKMGSLPADRWKGSK